MRVTFEIIILGIRILRLKAGISGCERYLGNWLILDIANLCMVLKNRIL